MKNIVKHNTRYQYLDRVFLEPHTLRLQVRESRYVSVINQELKISPEPTGRHVLFETGGSFAEFIWFKGLTNYLEVDVVTELDVKEHNPFTFLVYPFSCSRLPVSYPSELVTPLMPYLSSHENTVIKEWAHEIADTSNFEVIPFLSKLCRTMNKIFKYEVREDGPPHTAERTLEAKKGSCRDFSVLAIEACRQLGLASRFVSGYYWSDEQEEPDELHAWFEVYLPGAGWIGFDPTHGITCDHHHLTLCSSTDPLLTLPVTGTFRGVSSCRMKTDLSIETNT